MTTSLTTLAILLLTATLTYSQNDYTEFKKIENPNNLENTAYLPSHHLAILYGQTTKTATIYRTYNWQPITDPLYTDFHFAPSYVQSFTDDSHTANLIFSNSQGKIRQKSFNDAGSYSWSLWSIQDDNTNVKRATVSSNGKMFAAFCEDGDYVYLGNTSNTDQLVNKMDFKQYGPLESIRWRPHTTELYIAGGLLHNSDSESDRYLWVYDTATNTTTDITFLTHNKIKDMAFSSDGNKLFFVEDKDDFAQGQSVWSQPVWVHDLISKGIRQFDIIAADGLTSIYTSGNFLSASDGNEEFIWSIKEELFITSQYSSGRSGLSPDGSDLITTSNNASSFTIFKLCADMQHIYDAQDDTCKECSSPCAECFDSVDTCSTCVPRFYAKDDFTCGDCMVGCYSCQAEDTCSTCDAENHFELSNNTCICQTSYLLINETQCHSCSSFMQGCTKCSKSDACEACSDGFDLNSDNLCQQNGGSKTILIVIIVVAAILVVVLVAFLWKRHQKKKAKRINTSLESSPLEDYERVED